MTLPRSPNEKAVKAKQLYDNGIKLVDIAKQLDTPPGTVRRWKSTYEWDNKSERSEKKASVRKQNNKSKKESIVNEVDAVLENAELTEKQRLFCSFYVKYRNKVKAYQKAFQCSYENACGHASELWKNVEIQRCINQMLSEYRESITLDIRDLFRWYLDIARADTSDYLEWGREEIPVMGAFGPVKDDEGKPLTKVVNTVRFKESTEVDGILISEVKQGKDGASIKLADKMKAMEWLSQHIDIASDKQKAELKLLQAQIDKLNGTDNNDPDEHVTIVNDIKDLNE